MVGRRRSDRFVSPALHVLRFLLFATCVLLVHCQHRSRSNQGTDSEATVSLPQAQRVFPDAASVATDTNARGGWDIADAFGNALGYAVQTSPLCDDRIGFSGPTNVLVGLSTDNQVVGVDILRSGDTRDHIQQIIRDPHFLQSFSSAGWGDTQSLADIDAVSGATLSSLAIVESVIKRLSGNVASLRFQDLPSLNDAQQLFANAASIAPDPELPSVWSVFQSDGALVGYLLRTSPAADNVIGYQGPTDNLVGLLPNDKIVGLLVGKSYDNEPYVEYVREDSYFASRFKGLNLAELANLDAREAGIEGVSGATMTSLAVADGLIVAAQKVHRSRQAHAAQQPYPAWASYRNMSTMLVVALGVAIGLTRLRGVRILRLVFLLLVIVQLGILNGDMLSQAMLFGWAQSGIPWQNALGLVLLTSAAFLVPMTSKHNVYCSHICPHGAAQQLLMNRLPWKIRLSARAGKVLGALPAILLAWCILVSMAGLGFSLVDIEPFDAWIFRMAGWATISVAVVGLIASLFVPMAYCRFGCPTGALLGYLRFNARSGQWSGSDWVAIVLTLLAICLWFSV